MHSFCTIPRQDCNTRIVTSCLPPSPLPCSHPKCESFVSRALLTEGAGARAGEGVAHALFWRRSKQKVSLSLPPLSLRGSGRPSFVRVRVRPLTRSLGVTVTPLLTNERVASISGHCAVFMFMRRRARSGIYILHWKHERPLMYSIWGEMLSGCGDASDSPFSLPAHVQHCGKSIAVVNSGATAKLERPSLPPSLPAFQPVAGRLAPAAAAPAPVPYLRRQVRLRFISSDDEEKWRPIVIAPARARAIRILRHILYAT